MRRLARLRGPLRPTARLSDSGEFCCCSSTVGVKPVTPSGRATDIEGGAAAGPTAAKTAVSARAGTTAAWSTAAIAAGSTATGSTAAG